MDILPVHPAKVYRDLMSRPLRLEFPGALYHVIARGNRKGTIFHDTRDRNQWLHLMGEVCQRHNTRIHAYCQMGNHYHLMAETPDGNLHRAMRHLNSSYAQYFNWRHRQIGHLFQGRYKAILVQKESYLLELARYIVNNPVRSGQVAAAADWCWSSHLATAGKSAAPEWLDTTWLIQQFADTYATAESAYEDFVAAGVSATNPLLEAKHQLVLGDKGFVAQHADRLGAPNLNEVGRVQRRLVAMSLEEYADQHADRDLAMARAYHSTAFSMSQIAQHFKVSCQTVSRAVRRHTC